MLSVSPIASADSTASYFAGKAAYYFSDREGGSKWIGNLCSSLNVKGAVKEADLDQYLHGVLPDGRQMGKKVGDEMKHRPGYELCFNVPKSVSIQALMGKDQRLVEATWQATESVMKIVESWYIEARITKNRKTEFVKTNSSAAACFLHKTSRENDPQMHIHALIMNMTKGIDGLVRALATSRYEDTYGVRGVEAIFKMKKHLGLLFRSELARNIKTMTGYELEHGKNGFFEIKGVPPAVIQLFSKRSEQIKAACEEMGDHSAKAAQKANLLTRADKEDIPLKELQERWKDEVKALNFTPEQVIGHPENSPQKLNDTPDTVSKKSPIVKKLFSRPPKILTPEILAEHIVDSAVEASLRCKVDFSIADVMNESMDRAFSEVSVENLSTAANKRMSDQDWVKTEDSRYTTPDTLAQFNKFIATLDSTRHKPILSQKQWAQFQGFINHQQNKPFLHTMLTQSVSMQCFDSNMPDTVSLILDWVNGVRAVKRLPVVITCDQARATKLRDQIGIPVHTLASFSARLNNGRFKSTLTPAIYLDSTENMDKGQLMKTVMHCHDRNSWSILFAGNTMAPTLPAHNTLFHHCCEHLATTIHQIGKTDAALDKGNLCLLENTQQAKRIAMFTQCYMHATKDKSSLSAFAPNYLIDRLNQACRLALKEAGKVEDEDHHMPLLAPLYNSVSEVHQDTYRSGTKWWINSGLKGVKAYQWATVKSYSSEKQKVEIILENGKKKRLKLNDCIEAKGAIQPYRIKSQPVAVGDRIYATRVDEDRDIHRFERFDILGINENAIKIISHENQVVQDIDPCELPIFALDYVLPLSRVKSLDKTDTALMMINKNESHIRQVNIATERAGDITVISNNNQAVEKLLQDISPIMPITTQLAPPETPVQLASHAVTAAIDILSTKKAAFSRVELMQKSLEAGKLFGEVDIHQIESAMQESISLGQVIAKDDWLVPQAMIDCERAIIATVKAGIGIVEPMVKSPSARTDLFPEQQQIYTALLQSRDRFMSLQGYPGTGKTFLLDALKQDAGMKVMGLAATRAAVNEMQSKGVEAITVARFLVHDIGLSLTPNHLVIVDESSMLDNTQMRMIVKAVAESGARALLCGDVSQCKSIGAGNPLEMIFSHIQPLMAVDISRQKVQTLKDAVKSCINENLPQAFKLLGNNIIEESDSKHVQDDTSPRDNDAPLSRHRIIANAWLGLGKDARKEVLLPALTNKDRLELCHEIRKGLSREGTLTGESVAINALRPVHRDSTRYASLYKPGDILKVVSSIHHKLSADAIYRVNEIDPKHNTVKVCEYGGTNSKPIWVTLPGDKSQKEPFSVFREELMPVKCGDKLRLTDNIKDWQQFKHAEIIVKKIEKSAMTVQLTNGSQEIMPIGDAQAHFVDYNYVFTVYGVQGKTSKQVLTDFPSYTKNADLTHFLVSVSRATHELTVVTDNIEKLAKQIKQNTADSNLSHPIATQIIDGHASFKPPTLNIESSGETKPTPEATNKVPANDQSTIIKGSSPGTAHPQKTAKVTTASAGKATSTASTYKKYDIERINQALCSNAKHWLPLYTNKQIVQRGNILSVGQKNGSLKITIHGSEAGLWYDFSSGKGGNLIQLISDLTGKSFKDVLPEAALIVGGHYDIHDVSTQKLANASSKNISPADSKKLGFLEEAKKIVDKSVPIKGTLAEQYLRQHRGISDIPEYLRFHPSVAIYEKSKAMPALIGIVRDQRGELSRIQMIYLDPKTGKKSSRKLNKQTLGRGDAHGLCLNTTTKSQHVILAEGIETGVSIQEAVGDSAKVIVAFGKANLYKVDVPDNTKQITLACDNDGESLYKDHGYAKVIDKYRSTNVGISLAIPHHEGHDFNDVHRQSGAQTVRKAIQSGISADEFMHRCGATGASSAPQKHSEIETGKTHAPAQIKPVHEMGMEI